MQDWGQQDWDPLVHTTVMLGFWLWATARIEHEERHVVGTPRGYMESKSQEDKFMELRSIKDY